MIFNFLILLSVFGVIGVISTILADRRRRKAALKKWEDLQNDRRPKSEKDDDLIA
jgi:hypothetical protein